MSTLNNGSKGGVFCKKSDFRLNCVCETMIHQILSIFENAPPPVTARSFSFSFSISRFSSTFPCSIPAIIFLYDVFFFFFFRFVVVAGFFSFMVDSSGLGGTVCVAGSTSIGVGATDASVEDSLMVSMRMDLESSLDDSALLPPSLRSFSCQHLEQQSPVALLPKKPHPSLHGCGWFVFAVVSDWSPMLRFVLVSLGLSSSVGAKNASLRRRPCNL
mmetsp:Transcript_4205/g.6116  ORF Transcript_4205/g.6116 Transcript_4205/m.6116 type:complete len:216 (-) Transcript_4205:56-703(-)